MKLSQDLKPVSYFKRKVGNQVKMLKRIRVAGIKLGRLPPGKWRHLTEEEKEAIEQMRTQPGQAGIEY